jgi:hypothetical protein
LKFDTVFFLGAGASVPAGIPAASQLASSILATDPDAYPHKWFLDPGQARFIRHGLRTLVSHDRWGKASGVRATNIEEILEMLMMAERLNVRVPYGAGSETAEPGWMLHGLIWLTLLTIEKHSPVVLPDVYHRFARNVGPADAVITTNYDLIPERTIGRLHGTVDYGLGKLRPILDGDDGWLIGHAPPILKLHGSLNWRICQPGATQEGTNCGELFVFAKELPAYGYGLVRMCGCGHGEWHSVLIPPSFTKLLDSPQVRQIWRQASRVLRSCRSCVVIGYSLPMYDNAIKEFFRIAFLTNPTMRLIIVDPDESVAARFQAIGGRPERMVMGYEEFVYDSWPGA